MNIIEVMIQNPFQSVGLILAFSVLIAAANPFPKTIIHDHCACPECRERADYEYIRKDLNN